MAASVTVTVSGALLAALAYENCNSLGDQEGFLLGEVSRRVTATISDSQLDDEKEETNLKICCLVPCGQFELYDKQCCLQQAKIGSLLAGKEVVGWYRFRRQCPLQMSLREHVLHQRLAQWLGQRDLFLLALFRTTSSPTTEATHSLEHLFFSSNGALPVHLVNLRANHTDYHLYPGSAASIHQGAFSQLIGSAAQAWMPEPMLQLHNQLQTTLLTLQDQVAESEEELLLAAKHVQQLQQDSSLEGLP